VAEVSAVVVVTAVEALEDLAAAEVSAAADRAVIGKQLVRTYLSIVLC
jgi:hypothetical protein